MALNKLKFNSLNVTPAASEAIRFNSSANGLETTSSFGGNLKKLSTTTLSSAASSISFTSGIDSTYKEYIFIANNMHPSNDQETLLINFSIDGGSNYNVTKTSTFFMSYNNEAGTADVSLEYDTGRDLAQSTSDQSLTQFGIGADNDECGVSIIHLFDPSNTTFVKHFIAKTNSMGYHSDRYFVSNFCAGYCNTTSAIDGVQFKMSSGNIDSGVIKLYGVS